MGLRAQQRLTASQEEVFVHFFQMVAGVRGLRAVLGEAKCPAHTYPLGRAFRSSALCLATAPVPGRQALLCSQTANTP